MVKFLHWDSGFFNKTIGKLVVTTKNLPELNVNSYDVLYVHQNEDFPVDIPFFEQSFEDTKLVFQKNIETDNSDTPKEIKSVKNIRGDYKKSLYELGYLSGTYSRFKLDKNFCDADFKSLYRTWIDRSITLELADDIFVYLEANEVVGFVSFTINEPNVKLRLMAIDPSHRGKGIATKLMRAVEQHVDKLGISHIQIPTQLSNVSACSLYKKNGYHIIHKVILKHYWRHDSIQ